jgi:periplasmic protein TonB
MNTDVDGAQPIGTATGLFLPSDPSAGSTGEFVRLMLAPALVTIMVVGGYYWLHQQPAGPAERKETATTVTVRLLPEQAPAPIPTAPVSRKATANVASRTDVSPNEADQATADTTAPTEPPRELVPPEPPAPQLRPTSSPFGAPPSSASIRFQQAVLRHVALYYRYPKAAWPERLHGTVEAGFSMRRDGTLVGVWVKTGSGAAILDKAAIDAIRRAQPLPAIPSELPDPLSTQITLVFDPP